MNWFLLLCLLGSVTGQEPTPQYMEKNLMDWINGLLGWPTTTTTTQFPIINDPPSPPKECPACQCGITRTRRRIVGGSETKVTEFPWMAALMYNGNRFYCGAALINDLYVMTAAHCTAGFRKERIVVRFLEHDRSKKNETKTIDRKVAEIIRHLRYNAGTYDNDIALLKLDQRVDLSNAVKRLRDGGNSTDTDTETDPDTETDENQDNGLRSVCLPEKGLTYTNYTGLVTGWGTTEEGGAVSSTLQQVSVPIISNEECQNSKYGNRITENMICAGEPDGGKDACQGDSGGPMHVEGPDKKYHEVGVVSWGEGCARPGIPGVYTRVNRYHTWIKSNTKDACYCE